MSDARPVRPVAMIVHAYYEEDSRVRREAESLVAGGRPVDVFALRRAGDPPEGVIDGVRIRRLGVERHQGAGILRYLWEYVDFLVRSGWAVTRAHRRRRYALLEVHSLPDFLVFAGVVLKLAGIPILLDLHEAMPEFFRARFRGAVNPATLGLLRLQERLSIGFADSVLTVNDRLADRLHSLGVPSEKVTVVMNSPSLDRFDESAYPSRAFASDGVVRLVYAGALSPMYELDVALEALARIRERRPALLFHLDIYGRDYGESGLPALVERLRLGDVVTLHGRIAIEAVPAGIAGADIGLAPTRRDTFTDYSLSTKLFEYAAMGKAVVASRLPMVERTFPAGTVATYTPGDPDDLADRILGLVDDPPDRQARIARTMERVRELDWRHEAARLQALVDRLARDG